MQCKKCGSDLASGSMFCSQCGTKVELNKKICNQCGYELGEQKRFCSKCGTEYTGSSAISENETTKNAEKDEYDIEWDMVRDLHSKFKKIANRGYSSFGLISHPTLNPENAEENFIRQCADDVLWDYLEPNDSKNEMVLFFFDYDRRIEKRGKYEWGFMFTTRGIRAWYESMEPKEKWKLIPYETITSVERNRALLATVMDIKHGQGHKTRVFLDGMDDTKEFVEAVKKFIFDKPAHQEASLNGISIKTRKDKNSEVVEEIVKEVCKSKAFWSEYGKSSDDLKKENYYKCERLEPVFDVPADESIYLIYDSCNTHDMKMGLVLAGDNIYCKDNRNYRVYKWREVLETKISAGLLGMVTIGKEVALPARGDAKQIAQLLNEIKEKIEPLYSQNEIAVVSSEEMDAIEKIVREMCQLVNYKESDGRSSNDLQKINYDKCDKAISNFKIPAGETLYFIQDATLLGSMKTGFVLAGNKVYCKDETKLRVYEWEDLLNTDIRKKSMGYLGIGQDFELNCVNPQLLAQILNEIKEKIRQECAYE